MRALVLTALAAALALLASNAQALAVVTVSQPWVRPIEARGATRAYLIVGSSTDGTLFAARSPVADVVMMNGRARATAIALPAGQPVVMTDAGPHLALRHVAHRLALGDRVSITLSLRDADGRMQDIDVNAEVRNRSPEQDERRAHRAVHAH